MYGDKQLPMESNFVGACFNVNGSSYPFCVKTCEKSGDFYNISNGQDTIQVPIMDAEQLFDGKTLDSCALQGFGPINLTLSSASGASHINRAMNSNGEEFGNTTWKDNEDPTDFDIATWRRNYLQNNM